MELFVALVIWGLCAAFTAGLAMWAGDEPSGPFLLGLMTGPIAVIVGLLTVKPWQASSERADLRPAAR